MKVIALALSLSLVAFLSCALLVLAPKSKLYFAARYKATALIECSLPPPLPLDSSTSVDGIWSTDAHTLLRTLESKQMAARVLASFTVKESAILLSNGEKFSSAYLFGNPRFSYGIESGVVRFKVLVAHYDPNAAKLLADRYASVFLRYIETNLREADASAIAILKERQTEAQRRVNQAKASLHDTFANGKASDIANLKKDLNTNEDWLNKIADRLSTLERAGPSPSPFKQLLPTRVEKIDWFEF